MRFGNLPEWATELGHSIRDAVLFSNYVSECKDSVTCDRGKKACILPSEILWREPLFDQLILNVYQPGEVRITSEFQLVVCFLTYNGVNW